MQELNRLIISCGGTGGHFNPGLSTACAFRDAGGKPLLVPDRLFQDPDVGVVSHVLDVAALAGGQDAAGARCFW